MAIDYGEKERQFLDALKADTGRDLSEWMAAIDAAQLTHRNEIIDWLRRQGFMFSKASWLERIHTNAGQPIYAGQAARQPVRPRPRRELSARPLAPAPPDPPPPAPAQEEPPRKQPPAASDPAALETLLAKGKAFRPLAQHLITCIEKLELGIVVEPKAGHAVLSREGRTFGGLIVSPRDVRLSLALPGTPFDSGFAPARLPAGLPEGLTHAATLTDARQVNEALLSRIRNAALAP